MKKLFSLVCLVVLLGVSASVMGQGSQQTVTINSTRNYWVNSTDAGATQIADHIGNSYAWSVYTWDGTADYTLTTWTPTAAAGTTFNFVGASSGLNVYKSSIKWLGTGTYVVEIVETSTGTTACTTVRRFGVTIIDLDLLVVTKDHLGAALAAPGLYCNTNNGDIYGDADVDDLNNATVTPVMETMVMTYDISLFTAKGGTANIATTLPLAGWKFTVVDASVIPTTPGNVTWVVTGATGTYTTGGTNVLTVDPATTVVTITATIKNVAAAATEDYVLNFSIDPATVLVENGGASATDYAEGQEPATYIGGTAEPTSHKNSAVQITVNPIPNTTKIKFN
ncbi:MAG: hypothetical protein Q8R96_07125 [Bacteroidota bacterium]|nr:hypothetical protein [Bacteroidota bacterium]